MSRTDESKMVRYRRKPLTQEQVRRLKAVANVPDKKIDFSDIPDSLSGDLDAAVRGMFYRPVKRQTTLRIDADVLDWFKRNAPAGKGYQTDMNRVLRDYVSQQIKKAG